MSSTLFFLFIAIVLVGALIFVSITLTQNRKHRFDIEAYQTAFLSIENALIRENAATFNMSVVDADKLLDKAMHEMGIPGKNMSERLKRSGAKFTQLNAVWYAHKLRNQIAHEHGFKLDYKQAKHALATYRQALKDLGAI